MTELSPNRKAKMQLCRRAAYLSRCLVCLRLLEQYETVTSVRKYVFADHIQPVLRCSYTTFNNMLNEPNPQKQLEDIRKEIERLDLEDKRPDGE